MLADTFYDHCIPLTVFLSVCLSASVSLSISPNPYVHACERACLFACMKLYRIYAKGDKSSESPSNKSDENNHLLLNHICISE